MASKTQLFKGTIKNKAMLIALNQSFKTLNLAKDKEQKVRAFRAILQKATSMLKLLNTRLEGMTEKTEKKIKREKDKIKLNERIDKEAKKNMDLIDSELQTEYTEFNSEFQRLKNNIKEFK